MAINSVDMEQALTYQSYAQQALKSGDVSAEQKGQLVAKWGAENVNKWLSVDSTEYQIDDADYDTAKQAGKEGAKDSVGYDGGKTYISVGNAAASVGATVGTHVGGDAISAAAGKAAANAGKAAAASDSPIQNLSSIATAVMTAAIAAKYYLDKPNKDQHKAGEHLLSEELPEGFNSLNEAAADAQDASDEIAELTEEAEEKNEDANNKIEENKTLFDFYRKQYEGLKTRAEAGEELTPDEKALMKQLQPYMENLGEEIDDTAETTSSEVGDIYSDIDDYQETFDTSAEKIATVEGVTDYAEGFDSNAKTMMYVEAGAQGVNALSAGVAAARLWAETGFSFGTLTPFAVMATAAGIASGNAATQQVSWAGDMQKEIHTRKDVQKLGDKTTDIYEEEIDNFASNKEIVEDLEIDMPEDLTVPEDTANTDSTNTTTRGADGANTETPVTPAQSENDIKAEDDKKEKENK